MDKELNYMLKKILISETNTFLDEIDRLMVEDGVEKVMKAKKERNVKQVGRTQFKTIMDGISKAASVEEVFLFISYQESKGNGWDDSCVNRKSVAQNVIDSVQKILKKMEECIQKETRNSESIIEINEEDNRMIRLKIVEKYMGYLYWKATIITKKR